VCQFIFFLEFDKIPVKMYSITFLQQQKPKKTINQSAVTIQKALSEKAGTSALVGQESNH